MGGLSARTGVKTVKKYEVTIPFRKMPWFTGYVMATSKYNAIKLVKEESKRQGWTDAPGKASVVEVK